MREPLRYTMQRVDWWAVVSMLMLSIAALSLGYIIAAVIDFTWRHTR